MLDLWKEILSLDFMVRAIIVGVLVSLCASLLGVSLVLKRYSMIGDGLSHVGFGALAVAAAMNAAPLVVAIPVVLLAAFMLLRISENGKIKGDAAVALISAASLAIGVTVVSMTPGMNTDLNAYLFGNILTMKMSDVRLTAAFAAPALLLYVFFYDRIFAVTFDENFTRASGIRAGVYNALIASLTAIIIVLGMRVMGALLISSLIIFPSLTAMRVCKRFITVTVCAAAVSVFCFLAGVAGSYNYEAPTGAAIVIVNAIVFLLFWGISTMLSLFRKHKS